MPVRGGCGEHGFGMQTPERVHWPVPAQLEYGVTVQVSFTAQQEPSGGTGGQGFGSQTPA